MDFLTTGVITTAAAEVGIGGYDVNGNPIACSSALLTCANGTSTRSCRR